MDLVNLRSWVKSQDCLLGAIENKQAREELSCVSLTLISCLSLVLLRCWCRAAFWTLPSGRRSCSRCTSSSVSLRTRWPPCCSCSMTPRVRYAQEKAAGGPPRKRSSEGTEGSGEGQTLIQREEGAGKGA